MALRERSEGSSLGLTEVFFELPDVYASYEPLKSRGMAFSSNPRGVTEIDVRRLVVADIQKQGPTNKRKCVASNGVFLHFLVVVVRNLRLVRLGSMR